MIPGRATAAAARPVSPMILTMPTTARTMQTTGQHALWRLAPAALTVPVPMRIRSNIK